MQSDDLRIVVLEDNQADLRIIQESIRLAGLDCSFISFVDGVTAIEYLDDETSPVPALVILDLNVPGAGGAEVLNSVRSNIRWSHVPVFIFTGSQAPADISRMKNLGSDRYVVKPVDLEGFLRFGQDVTDWLEERLSHAGGAS